MRAPQRRRYPQTDRQARRGYAILVRSHHTEASAKADHFLQKLFSLRSGVRIDMPVQIAEPSVMSLIIQMRKGTTALGTGTAFVVIGPHGPVLVTNRHNVTGRNQETGTPLSASGVVPDCLAIMHNRLNRLGEWIERVEPLYSGNAPRWTEHPVLGAAVDCVALPLTETSDVQFHPYDANNPGPDISVGPAAIASVIGFPFGLSSGGYLAIWATGFIASEPSIAHNNLPLFLIDCRSRPGQSGSPVIAYRPRGLVPMEDGSTVVFSAPTRRLLGIYSGRINNQSDLGFVWNTRAIAEIVSAS